MILDEPPPALAALYAEIRFRRRTAGQLEYDETPLTAFKRLARGRPSTRRAHFAGPLRLMARRLWETTKLTQAEIGRRVGFTGGWIAEQARAAGWPRPPDYRRGRTPDTTNRRVIRLYER